ncbi:MAG: hypothetical protein IJ463_02785 [Bacilli bacterium]|nr:hypothetical protein [Bacilli bacterium]
MDYIYITDENNNKIKMELVTTFELKNRDYKYIIYCELDKSHFYLAKYKDNIEELNTDFSESEYKLCNEIFKEVTKKWN